LRGNGVARALKMDFPEVANAAQRVLPAILTQSNSHLVRRSDVVSPAFLNGVDPLPGSIMEARRGGIPVMVCHSPQRVDQGCKGPGQAISSLSVAAAGVD
jgi:hypothetical protein